MINLNGYGIELLFKIANYSSFAGSQQRFTGYHVTEDDFNRSYNLVAHR